MRKLIALCLLPAVLSGCAVLLTSAVTEVGVSAAEERSFGTKIDDHVVYLAVHDQFLKSEKNDLVVMTTINVRHGRVMLTGNVPSHEVAQQAVSLARQSKGVKEVIDELIVNPNSTYGAAANDLLVKKNLEARLLMTRDVWVINYSIDVVAGNAYLLGYVKDNAEMSRVVNIVRTTKGVKRMVNHLLVNDAIASENIDAAPTPPVTESPILPPQSPTEGTISTEPVESSDVSAPQPAAKPAAPRWR